MHQVVLSWSIQNNLFQVVSLCPTLSLAAALQRGSRHQSTTSPILALHPKSQHLIPALHHRSQGPIPMPIPDPREASQLPRHRAAFAGDARPPRIPALVQSEVTPISGCGTLLQVTVRVCKVRQLMKRINICIHKDLVQ